MTKCNMFTSNASISMKLSLRESVCFMHYFAGAGSVYRCIMGYFVTCPCLISKTMSNTSTSVEQYLHGYYRIGV